VAEDDLAEMGAALKIAVCVGRLVDREYVINQGLQLMQRDCPVHRLEIGSAADANRTEYYATSAQQQRGEHDVGSRQAPLPTMPVGRIMRWVRTRPSICDGQVKGR
jgi:hypothetical protein